ncbi:histidinol dehydrogenase [Buchnera aphidicola]|uniref:histidinol dehydrogenase n=1 Tax=Buchnera aphidicola TaxID=9 RepID=UPI0034639E4D
MLSKDKIISWELLSSIKKKKMLLRPITSKIDNLSDVVKSIIHDVKKFGDMALNKYTEKFDNIHLKNIKVDKKNINNAQLFVSKAFQDAILIAKKNIELFHMQQNIKPIDIETQRGIRCQQITLPIESVGLYVPGGTAPLVSTVLMLAIPARIAGCKNIILCSPPPITNEILYTANVCGIENIFSVGGAQAIAALGFGTDTILKVNKIFGPGNAYVTEAKIQLNRLVPGLSIDMVAGPSELLIIADKTSNPTFIASDILSQLEHGTDSQVIVLTPDKYILEQVIIQINKQLIYLSRSEIILKALKHTRFILVKNILECISISNIYAPEHLIIQTENPRSILSKIVNAGSVFLGLWSPESVGDYASGTNHVLPTNKNAISYSGLSVLDFQKKINVQELTINGLKNISNIVKVLSSAETMDAHKNSITVRINAMQE